MQMLVNFFDQHDTTVGRDVKQIVEAWIDVLYDKWIHTFQPYSQAYTDNKCVGRVSIFPNILYIGDCTSV